jgi:hypothetical protein
LAKAVIASVIAAAAAKIERTGAMTFIVRFPCCWAGRLNFIPLSPLRRINAWVRSATQARNMLRCIDGRAIQPDNCPIVDAPPLKTASHRFFSRRNDELFRSRRRLRCKCAPLALEAGVTSPPEAAHAIAP